MKWLKKRLKSKAYLEEDVKVISKLNYVNFYNIILFYIWIQMYIRITKILSEDAKLIKSLRKF
jgi:uncharacterized protein YfeS